MTFPARRVRVSYEPDAGPADPPPITRNGGRAPPSVRRDPAPAPREPLIEGFRESVPFLFFGVAFLILAIWLYAIKTAPVGGLPIWILFAGIGIIALVGGLVGALTQGEEEEPAAPPRRVSSPRVVIEEVAARRAAMAETPPPARSVGPVLTPAAAAVPAPRRIATSPAYPTPAPASPAPSARPMPVASPSWEGSTQRAPFHPLPAHREPDPAIVEGAPTRRNLPVDDVLQSLDELSSYLAMPRPTEATVMASASLEPPPPPNPSRSCAGCENGIALAEEAAPCRGCGLSLCTTCAAGATQEGHQGVCPTCAVLDEVAAGARAA